MDVRDLHPIDESSQYFIWHEWIQAHGPLTNENLFDYFSISQFYDKQSNNQVLRMQTMHTGMPIPNEAEELRRFTGVEFAIVHSEPPSLFIVQKRERLSPDEVRPLSAYFIVNNRIYQAPDIYTVLSNRLLTSLFNLQSSLDILRNHKPDYTPRTGFVWPIKDPTLSDDLDKRRSTDEELSREQEKVDPKRKVPSTAAQSAVPKKQQNTLLLFNAMRTTAAHSAVSFSSQALNAAADSEGVQPQTPAPGTGARTSATPVPQAIVIPTTQDAPLKGPTKKKRKRTLMASLPS